MPLHTIDKVEFQAGRDGPRLLITAGIHGDEFEGIAAAQRVIAHFRDSPAALSCGRLTIVPVVNQAAFVRGTRTAGDHLDLARVCPGKLDGSTTERTAFFLSELIRSAGYYIDLHSGGTEFTILPLCGYMLHADARVLDAQRAMARAFNLPIVWGTSAEHEGRSLSVARDAGIPAIYAEYRGGGRCDPQGVEAYVAGCLRVMSWLEMLDTAEGVDSTAARIEHVIEDARRGSGHLQVCNPSPVTGFFEPAVLLGQRVDRGQPLGRVRDILGNACCEIVAPYAGLVLMLRTFPRVRQGESVGVVLEVE